jgi:putative CocE/NonD family hydrolase
MKKIRLLLLSMLILSALGVRGQERKIPATEEYVTKNYVKHASMIPMRDGVKLYTAIYVPTDSTVHHPIIMMRTPYGCDPYDESEISSGLWSLDEWYAANHYIIVYQDVRGTNKSEGEFSHIRPYLLKKGKKDIDESSDTYDTADWLIHHTCNNGCIGVRGVSYPGFYATMAGLSGHPAIKAVSPQAPVTDWFRGDDVHHNGAFMLADMFSFLSFFCQLCHQPQAKMDYKESSDIYSNYLKMGTMTRATQLMGSSNTWWTQMMNHPNLDEFWKARNPEQYMYLLGKMKSAPAVLIVGGLFDAEDQYGTFSLYQSLHRQAPKVPLYLTVGPWTHGGWMSSASKHLGQTWLGTDASAEDFLKNVDFPFFDYYLNGKGAKPAPAVRMFYTGENKWHEYENWPTATADSLRIYLNADKTLTSKPLSGDSCVTYTSDPAHPVHYTASLEKGRNTKYMAEDQRFAGLRADVVSSAGVVHVLERSIPGEGLSRRAGHTRHTRHGARSTVAGEVLGEDRTVVIFLFVTRRVDREALGSMRHLLVADSRGRTCFQCVNPRITDAVGELFFLSPCHLLGSMSENASRTTFFSMVFARTHLITRVDGHGHIKELLVEERHTAFHTPRSE